MGAPGGEAGAATTAVGAGPAGAGVPLFALAGWDGADGAATGAVPGEALVVLGGVPDAGVAVALAAGSAGKLWGDDDAEAGAAVPGPTGAVCAAAADDGAAAAAPGAAALSLLDAAAPVVVSTGNDPADGATAATLPFTAPALTGGTNAGSSCGGSGGSTR